MDKSDFITWAKKLAANYQPNDALKSELQNIEFIAIVGPTGAGKTTLIDKLGITKVLSDVSRAPRPGEKDKRDYFFRTDFAEILSDIKQGLYAQFLIAEFDEFYGTRRKSYPEKDRAIMAVRADQIETFRSLGFGSFHQLFVMPPGYIEWMHRIGSGNNGDSFNKRLEEAKISLHAALQDDRYSLILNDTIERALSDIKLALQGNTIPQERAELARQTAGYLLEKLGAADDLF